MHFDARWHGMTEFNHPDAEEGFPEAPAGAKNSEGLPPLARASLARIPKNNDCKNGAPQGALYVRL